MKDYIVELALQFAIQGYGKSIVILTPAADKRQAEKEARKDFTALTGWPETMIVETYVWEIKESR